MREKIIVYPTSANPPSWGHADIMYRAAQVYDKVYWVAAQNPVKMVAFSLPERMEMMQAYVDFYELKNVIVDSNAGAIVRYAESKQAQFLLRGLRNTTDFQAEWEMAAGNRGISKKIETICLFSKPHYATISSSLIRELAGLGERIDQYVLPSLVEKIRSVCQKSKSS
jgi:pantetheine-phosphate adenylyltransferase